MSLVKSGHVVHFQRTGFLRYPPPEVKSVLTKTSSDKSHENKQNRFSNTTDNEINKLVVPGNTKNRFAMRTCVAYHVTDTRQKNKSERAMMWLHILCKPHKTSSKYVVNVFYSRKISLPQIPRFYFTYQFQKLTKRKTVILKHTTCAII